MISLHTSSVSIPTPKNNQTPSLFFFKHTGEKNRLSGSISSNHRAAYCHSTHMQSKMKECKLIYFVHL